MPILWPTPTPPGLGPHCKECRSTNPTRHAAWCPQGPKGLSIGRPLKKPIVLAKDTRRPQPKKKRRTLKGRR